MKIARIVQIPDVAKGGPDRAFHNLQDNNYYLRMTTEATLACKTVVGNQFSTRCFAGDELCNAGNWSLGTEFEIPDGSSVTFSSPIGPRVGPDEKLLTDAIKTAETKPTKLDLHPIQRFIIEQQEKFALAQQEKFALAQQARRMARQASEYAEKELSSHYNFHASVLKSPSKPLTEEILRRAIQRSAALEGSMVEQVARELKQLDTRCQNVSTTGFRCRHEVYERHACETPAGFPIGRIVAGQTKPGEQRHHFGGVILDLPAHGPHPKPAPPRPVPTMWDRGGAPRYLLREQEARARVSKIAALGTMALDTLHDRLPRRWTKRAWRT